jgi:hypothetical protein
MQDGNPKAAAKSIMPVIKALFPLHTTPMIDQLIAYSHRLLLPKVSASFVDTDRS